MTQMRGAMGPKISIVGTGYVGSTIAYTLVTKCITSELVLIDKNTRKAEGEAMDIGHGVPFADASSLAPIVSGDFSDTAGSDIVVITAGANRKPGEARTDMILRNAIVMRDVASQIAKYSPDAVLIVIANPVDALSYVAQKVTGFPPERVIGSGTILDVSRLRYLLSKETGVAADSIHAYVFGEHGDSSFVPWSLTRVADMGIEEASHMFNLDSEKMQHISDAVHTAGQDVIKRKGATYFGITLCTIRIIEAIVRNEKIVLPVSSLMSGDDNQYGIKDVYLSIPTALGERGVEYTLAPKLNDDEMKKLRKSAEVIKKVQSKVI